jgi:hypothetical protein
MMKFRVFLVVLIVVLGSHYIQAQVTFRDSAVSLALFMPSIGLQAPGGDLAERFGPNGNAGFHFMYKWQNNFVLGADGQFLFGNILREDSILSGIQTSQGEIIDAGGQFASVFIYQRGMQFNARAGYVWNAFGPNDNSGILLTGGIGFLQHRVEFQSPENRAPQISPEYLKGYDRLTNGVAFTQSIGYMNLANNRRANFYFGFDFTQAITQNRRSWNFDQRAADDRQRLDLLFGFRAGYIFPAYKKAKYNSEFYYD